MVNSLAPKKRPITPDMPSVKKKAKEASSVTDYGNAEIKEKNVEKDKNRSFVSGERVKTDIEMSESNNDVLQEIVSSETTTYIHTPVAQKTIPVHKETESIKPVEDDMPDVTIETPEHVDTALVDFNDEKHETDKDAAIIQQDVSDMKDEMVSGNVMYTENEDLNDEPLTEPVVQETEVFQDNNKTGYPQDESSSVHVYGYEYEIEDEDAGIFANVLIPKEESVLQETGNEQADEETLIQMGAIEEENQENDIERELSCDIYEKVQPEENSYQVNDIPVIEEEVNEDVSENENNRRSPAEWLNAMRNANAQKQEKLESDIDFGFNADGFYNDVPTVVEAKPDTVSKQIAIKVASVAAALFLIIAFLVYYA